MKDLEKRKYNLCFLFVVSYAALLLISVPVFAQNSVIIGAIKNGTTGKPEKVESLTLMGFEAGMEILEERSNANTAFTFTNIKPSVNFPYLIQVEYKGVKYNASVLIPSGEDTVAVEVVVYETTNEAPNIVVSEVYYQFGMIDNTLQVVKRFSITNDSVDPRTYINENGTFKFNVSPESHGISYITVSTGLVPVNQDPIETDERGVFAINYPLKPGVTQIEMAYHIDYSAQLFTFSEDLLYEYHNLIVVTSPANMILLGGGLEKAGGDAHQDFTIYQRDHIALGENISFGLSGGTPNPMAGSSPVRPIAASKMGFGEKVLTIIVIFAILGIGSYVSRNKAPVRETQEKGMPKKLRRRREVLLAEIAALDDQFGEQRIIEPDYQRQRVHLKNQLIELYKKIEKTS